VLLFDQNLSPELPRRLSDVFPGSRHVREIGLEKSDDEEVWRAAAAAGLCIVSKDSDFQEKSVLSGAPPKILWIQRGNCSTEDILSLLRDRQQDLLAPRCSRLESLRATAGKRSC